MERREASLNHDRNQAVEMLSKSIAQHLESGSLANSVLDGTGPNHAIDPPSLEAFVVSPSTDEHTLDAHSKENFQPEEQVIDDTARNSRHGEEIGVHHEQEEMTLMVPHSGDILQDVNHL